MLVTTVHEARNISVVGGNVLLELGFLLWLYEPSRIGNTEEWSQKYLSFPTVPQAAGIK